MWTAGRATASTNSGDERRFDDAVASSTPGGPEEQGNGWGAQSVPCSAMNSCGTLEKGVLASEMTNVVAWPCAVLVPAAGADGVHARGGPLDEAGAAAGRPERASPSGFGTMRLDGSSVSLWSPPTLTSHRHAVQLAMPPSPKTTTGAAGSKSLSLCSYCDMVRPAALPSRRAPLTRAELQEARARPAARAHPYVDRRRAARRFRSVRAPLTSRRHARPALLVRRVRQDVRAPVSFRHGSPEIWGTSIPFRG